MRHNKVDVYLHLVWGTWDRLPLIEGVWERALFRCIESEYRSLGCEVLALNGVSDHVHLLVNLPTTLTIAQLVKQVKGVSSRFVNTTLKPSFEFRWQGYYGAFSVSRGDVSNVMNYIRHQKAHHAANELIPQWEEISVERVD